MTVPDRPRHPRVDLLQLPSATIDALAGADLALANATSPIPLPAAFVDLWRGLWQMRSDQLRDDPGAADWITRVIRDRDSGQAVGRAGFHGPPDADGMVEVGYAVDPVHRRCGYARAALELLLARAATEPGVRTVRASISPDNVASRDLVLQYGFVRVAEQWDEEDGLEIVFEVAA